MREFEYLSIFKYAYTALLHNQFDDLCPYDERNQPIYTPPVIGKNYSYPCCFLPTTDTQSCSPFSQVGDSWPDGTWSMFMLLFIYVGCYLIAWGILVRLSSTYE
jgi:hypothetical protein